MDMTLRGTFAFALTLKSQQIHAAHLRAQPHLNCTIMRYCQLISYVYFLYRGRIPSITLIPSRVSSLDNEQSWVRYRQYLVHHCYTLSSKFVLANTDCFGHLLSARMMPEAIQIQSLRFLSRKTKERMIRLGYEYAKASAKRDIGESARYPSSGSPFPLF